MLPGLIDRPADRFEGPTRTRTVHAEERAQVHPRLVRTVPMWARPRTARSTTRSATTGARCCGLPTSAPSITTRRSGWPTRHRPTIWCSTLTHRRRLREGCGRRAPGASGAHGQRAYGAIKTSGAKGVHSSSRSMTGGGRRRGRSDPALAARAEALDPDIATTAFIVADRGGKVFSTPRAQAGPPSRRVQPRLRPGTPVSFPLKWSELD